MSFTERSQKSLNPKLLKEIAARIKKCPSKTAILTDIDGTLYPIQKRPEIVGRNAGIPGLLDRLADEYEVVGVITGREMGQAKAIVPAEKIVFVANHGLEYEINGGMAFAEGVEPYLPLIERAYHELAADPALKAEGLIIENKKVTIAVHYRLAPGLESRIEEIVERTAAKYGLEMKTGRKVYELHPKVDINKGTAVSMIIDSQVNLVLYVGDDVSDIDVFRALKNKESRKFSSITIGVVSDEVSELIEEESVDYFAANTGQILELLSLLV